MKHIVSSLYAEYGRYIDTFRAIPSDIDCLKPVERRLLLSIHQEARKKLQKSAKVIGHCMGNYHPHGDCLFGNTKIYTLDSNIESIEKIYESGIDKINTLGVDKNNNIIPVTAHSFRIGQYTDTIYKIELHDGSIIRTTNNHQFNTINRGWVKAEELKTTDLLYAIRNNKTKENYIYLQTTNFNVPIHRLVYNYYNKISDRDIVHHIDENKFNNNIGNLTCLTRSKHAKIHNSKSNLDGLSKGLDSMFSNNGKYREQTRAKNSTLMEEYNKNQTLIKSIKVLKYIRDQGLDLTIENYIDYREQSGIYNAPFINKIIGKYVNSFEDLVSIIDTFKIDTSKAKGSTKNLNPVKTKKNTNYIHELTLNLANKLVVIVKTMKLKYGVINYNLRNLCMQKTGLSHGNISGRSYPTILKLKLNNDLNELIKPLPIASQLIKEITIEKLDKKVPMYDFTVDEHANMFIVGNTFENGISLINVHNSSTYKALVQLVHRGIVEGQGNWGKYGYPNDDNAAAYRYTECKAVDGFNQIFEKYLKYVPHKQLEFEEEPLFIPFPVPIGLIGSGFTTGIGFHTTKIPRYKFTDLLRRLVDLLENKSNPTIIQPFVKDCKVVEEEIDSFESILKEGFGRIKIIPNYSVKSDKVVIYGRNPLTGFNRLKTMNEKYEEENKLPYFDALDLTTFESKTTMILELSPPKRGVMVTNEFARKVISLVTSIENVLIHTVHDFNTVRLCGIDELLLQCYDKWKETILKFYKNDRQKLKNKLNELQIIIVIRDIIHQNPSILVGKRVEDIVNFNNSNYTDQELISVCSKYNIKTLVESHIDIASIQKEITSLDTIINDIDNFVLNDLKKTYNVS